MAFCSNCGKQLPEGARFCGNCGSMQPTAPVAPAYTQPAPPVHTQPETPVYAQPEAPAETELLQPEAAAYAQPVYDAVPPAEPAKKKNIWKILLPIIGGVVLVALIVVLILVFSKTHVESVSILNDDEIRIMAGDDHRVEYEVFPKEHDDEITWDSSDEDVATVRNGRISAEGAGACTITLYADGEPMAEIVVQVYEEVYVQFFALDDPQVNLTVGESYAVSWAAEPYNHTEKLSWLSSDPSVATVDQSGEITAVGQGSCIVTLSAPSGASVEVEVFVIDDLSEETLAACGEWYSYGAYLNDEYAYYDGLYLWLDGDGTGFIVLEDGEELYFNWHYIDYDYECYFYEAIAEDGSECMFVVYYTGEYAGDLDFYLTDELWIFFE